MLSTLDWIILCLTLFIVVAYGIWKTRGSKNIEAYLLGNKDSKWWMIGLSVMATQASAITFLSTPGQAYSDGLRFVQFYFGMPFALIFICIFFIPIYQKLKVFTAYEYLESRFDIKNRTLASVLFLIQRGLGAGITIYAPAIILSSILGWDLNITILVIGILVIIYTVSGGTRAVSQTHKLQMIVIFVGMFIAFYSLIDFLPDQWSFRETLKLAGASNKLNAIDLQVDLNNRYTVWSGILAGFFLHLSYFGTDQSQVQRYLSGRTIRESRLGLLFNAFLKVPMQFFILLTGVLVFLFYQFNQAPVFFNQVQETRVLESPEADKYRQIEEEFTDLFVSRQKLNADFVEAIRNGDEQLEKSIRTELASSQAEESEIRNRAKAVISEVNPEAETNDRDYVFITFILNHLPKGVIGILLAMILSAAMSSTAAELNALGSTTTVDIYKRSLNRNKKEHHYLNASRLFTMMWGVVAILFALFGTLFENLIQFVNIVGSLFYGTVLGMFIVAFFIKWIRGNAVFFAALLAESVVLYSYVNTDIGYLWYNVIGCAGVVVFGLLFQLLGKSK
jgi:Na+/proline symporter